MTQTDPTVAQPTPGAISSWLADRVAHYLQEPAGEIDHDRPLIEYGLDSVYAVALCGDIADVWGPSLDPAVIWDVDTIAKLAGHLGALLSATPAERSTR
jgi:acyl carrier protein